MDNSTPNATPPEPSSTSSGPSDSGPSDPGPADPGPTSSGPAGSGLAGGGEEHLHRCRDGRMLAGVAAGLADYFDIDPTLVRIGFVALAFLGGLAVPLYLAGWLLIPEEDTDVSVAEELLARERAR
ncbi:MAG: PspC domain-containing protein [Acidimicrobiales bacterium]